MVRILALTILLGLTFSAFGQIELKDDKIGIGTLAPLFDVHLKADTYQFQDKLGTDLMRINSNGNVGIGTAAPTSTFHVFPTLAADYTNALSGSLQIGRFTSGASVGIVSSQSSPSIPSMMLIAQANNSATTADMAFNIRETDNTTFSNLATGGFEWKHYTTNLMRILRNGYLGIGTTSPSEKLHVNGSITYAGSIYQASDKRLKSDISSFEYGLDEVLKLNPINFRYNEKISDKRDLRVGVIAQELQKTAPELVTTFNLSEENDRGEKTSEDEYLKIDDSAIKYMLVNSIKEQQFLIENLQSQVNELKGIIGNGRIENPLINKIEVALENSEKEELAYLAQNIPNPTRDATIVKYFVPESANSATVRFFSLSGQILDEIEINKTGQGEIKVDLEKMNSGNYMYALIVDGELIDTKTMAIAK